jgi:hypothetical protein
MTKVISAKALLASEGFRAYEMEEFALANAIYTALVEGHAAEISARRTAMENASNVGRPFTVRADLVERSGYDRFIAITI